MSKWGWIWLMFLVAFFFFLVGSTSSEIGKVMPGYTVTWKFIVTTVFLFVLIGLPAYFVGKESPREH
jgi:hypothetical protein